jgi:glycosyltransferase involved in cell wall biosynthesis
MTPFLSIIIPAYNEEETIRKNNPLKKVHSYLKKQKYTWTVTVVDDGSTDNTASQVEKFSKTHKNFFLQKEPHRGKGATVTAGILKAKGKIVLFTDMDQSTPISHISDFLPKFESGSDIVIGQRKGRKGAPFYRKLMAFGFVLLRTIFLRLPLKDTQCGFKAFTHASSQKVFAKMKYFLGQKNIKGAAVNAGFDIEFLFLARKLGYKISEVPVNWNYGERRKVSLVKDSLEAVKDVLRIRLNALKGKYK